VEFVRQINEGKMQVKMRNMQVREYNPQVKDSFRKVGGF
jgi:hypothetical protein